MMGAKRSGIPLVYTGKYRPRIRVSYSPPLPIGITSECELIDFFISEYISPLEAQNRLQASLPEGIMVLKAKVLSYSGTPVGRLIDTAQYAAKINCDSRVAKKLISAVNDFLNSAEIYVRRIQPRSVRDINIRKGVHRLEISENESGGELVMKMIVDDGTRGTVKPREVVDYILQMVDADDEMVRSLSIHRMALFQMKGGRFISPMEARSRSYRGNRSKG